MTETHRPHQQPARRASRNEAFILVAVGDPLTHPEAMHVAAATGHGVVDTGDPRDITRHFLRADAVLVDAETAGHVATLGRRERIYFLAPDPGPVDWRAALTCHADQAFLLPAQAPELLAELGHVSNPRGGAGQGSAPGRDRRTEPAVGGGGAVIAVLGSCGGAGASTLAGAIARVAAQGEAGPVALVDGVENSGGLDLLLGLEESPGARWPDLRLGEGAVAADDLRSALPTTRDGIAVLAAARSTIADPFELDPQAVAAVLESLGSGTGLTVVDLAPDGPLSTSGEVVLNACDHVALVVPAEVRPAAAAARLTARLVHGRTPVTVVARHRGWSGLTPEDLEKLARADVIAELGTIARLPRTVELTGLPDPLPRPLATAARAVLDEAGRR